MRGKATRITAPYAGKGQDMTEENTQSQNNAEEAKTFTQEEVDEIVKKRVTRAKNSFATDYEELKEKAKKFDEAQEANKTELQKAQERISELQSTLDAQKKLEAQNAIKSEVSKKTGVPVELLSGNTEEEMQKFAEAIQDFAGHAKAPVSEHAGQFSSPKKEDNEALREYVRQLLPKS